MTKTTQTRYTLELKQEAVRLVECGQSQVSVTKTRWCWLSRPCSTGSRREPAMPDQGRGQTGYGIRVQGQSAENPLVGGSIPSPATISCGFPAIG